MASEPHCCITGLTQSFNFLNKKPAGRMIRSPLLFKGWGWGKSAHSMSIKAGDAQLQQQGTGRPQLPGWIESLPCAGNGRSLPDSLRPMPTQSSALPGKRPCWSAYLSSTPGLQDWARVNQEAAKALEREYDQC